MSTDVPQQPFNRFVYVLSVVKQQYGEPCPELSTYSYYYQMDPFRVLAKSLKVMNDIRHDRINSGDDSFEINSSLDDDVATMDLVRQYTNPEDLTRLFSVHDQLKEYFFTHNNIHEGVYHMFILHRYLIDDDHRHVKQREVNIYKSTREEIERFFS